MAEKLRIYIGGLGSGVQEDDLKSRFTSPQLGTVESVELIRSKGRSFGYLEFVPSSDKGLAKLFSTYNGCMWKGGILKLEKARVHYLTRLQHEWEEEAELKTKSSFQKVNADENVYTFQKPITHQNIEKMQLKIFFPKLRKVKPIPLKGSGKHKYSFQRVQIPPLPIHFCDCEEHSGSLLAQRNHTNNHARDDHETDDHETDVCEVNEDELNMMKTVLDKLLEKGNCSDKVPCRNEFTEEVSRDATSVDKHQVEDGEEDEVSNDDEDIVINVANRPSRRVDVFEDWGWKTTAVDQDYFPIEPVSFSEPHELWVNKNVNLLADKKRKLPAKHIHADNSMRAERQPAKRVRRGSGDDPVSTSTQPIHTESGSKESSNGVAGLHKSAWRDLVKEKQSSAFQISDILVDDHPEAEMKTGCDVTPSSTGKDDRDDEMDNGTDDGDDQLSKNDKLENGRDDGDDQLSKNDKLENRKNDGDDKLSNNDELEKVLHAQSAKAGTSNAKTARGVAWLQKSSWLQLIKDVNSSSFNLAQVLPETASEKQELLPHNCNTPTNSGHGEKCKDLDKNQKSLVGVDILKPQVTLDKGVHDASVNLNVSNSAKKLNRVSQDQEQPDLNQSGEKKDEVPAPMPNFLRNARAVGDVVVSETCPFMRNAASMREWTKMKAALSGTHKKRGKGGKVLTQDQ